jgi:predicted Zn-dependent peptidase
MHDYFASRYASDNLFVAAAGKVDFDALVKQVEKRCADWKPQSAKRDVPRASSKAKFEVVHRPTATQQYVLQLGDAPASEDEDRYAAKLLATIVGDDSGSRMYWELTDPGYAETASLGHYEYLGAGMFYTWLACEPDDVEENLDRLQKILVEVERTGITADELKQAKNKVKARVVLSSERPQSRLFNLGGNWLQRREYRTVADDIRSLDGVTAEQIRDVLKKYPLTNVSTITVGPREDVKQPA